MDTRYFTQIEVLELIEGAAFSFHPSDTADGVIAGYNIMFDIDTDEAESTIAVEIVADDTIIKAFITETGQPTFTAMSAGVYAGQLHLSATTAGKKDTKIYWTLSKRAAGGSETLLITSEESAVLTNNDVHYEIHGSLTTDQTILSDDRLVLKVYGNQDTGAGGNATATLHMEGTTATRIDVQTHFAAFDDRYLFKDGTNANATVNIGSQDLQTTGTLTNGTQSATALQIRTGLDYLNQAVQTGSSPTFADLTLSAPVNIYALSHNSFANHVANEHIDWTGATQSISTTGDVQARNLVATSILKHAIKRNIIGNVVFGRASGVGLTSTGTSIPGNTGTTMVPMNGGNWIDFTAIGAAMSLYNSSTAPRVLTLQGSVQALANGNSLGYIGTGMNTTVGPTSTASSTVSSILAPNSIPNGTAPNNFTLKAKLNASNGVGTVTIKATMPAVPVLNQLESVWK